MSSYILIGTTLLVLSAGLLAYCLINRHDTWFGWLLCVVASCAILFVTGCSSLGNTRPHDWPELKVSVHKSGFMKKEECNGTLGGCAYVEWCSRTCYVYLQIDSKAIEEHERGHCAGYDHDGDSTMADSWNRWKKDKDQQAFCKLRMGEANFCRVWPEFC